ncbi:PKD domain-containing protein [Nanoarchaeota archaeon]
MKNKILIWIIGLIVLLSYAYGADWPASLTYIGTPTQVSFGTDIHLELSDTTPVCFIGSNCWGAYKDGSATVTFPYNFSIKTAVSALNPQGLNGGMTIYDWYLTYNVTGVYQLNITLNNGTANTTNNVTVNITSQVADPNITITIQPNNAELIVGMNFTFNLTLNNTGNGSAYNISVLLMSDRQGIINFTGGNDEDLYLTLPNVSNMTVAIYNFSLFVLNESNTDMIISTNTEKYLKEDGFTIYANTPNFYITEGEVNFSIYGGPDLDFSNTLCDLKESSILVNSSLIFDMDTCVLWDQDKSQIMYNYTPAANMNIMINQTTPYETNITPDINYLGVKNITFNITDPVNVTDSDYITLYVQNSSTETCDGVDNDGDTVVDEFTSQSCCPNTHICSTYGTFPCMNGAINTSVCYNYIGNLKTQERSSGGSGSSTLYTGPTAKITNPEEGDFFTVGFNIPFTQASSSEKGITDYYWSFGEYGIETTKAYEDIGEEEVSLTVTDILDMTDTDSVKFTIVNCIADTSCDDENPLTTDSCLNPRTLGSLCQFCTEPCVTELECVKEQNAYTISRSCTNNCCEYEHCEPQCKSDSDCDDDKEETNDECKEQGSCEAYCDYEKEEKPKEEIPKSERLPFPTDLSTQYMATVDEILEQLGLKVTTELYVSNGKSEIRYRLGNEKLISLYNVSVTVIIPKSIAQSTDEIEGNFEVINSDPVIRFYIPKIPAGKSVMFSYKINKEMTEDMLKQIKWDIDSQISEKELQELTEKTLATQNATSVRIKSIYEDEKTKIETQIRPKKAMKDVRVYLEIPKCLAKHIKDIKFNNQKFEVVKDDPIVVWHYAELTDKIDLQYEVEGKIDEDCLKQIKTLPIAEYLGEDLLSPINWFNMILPFLIVPILGFILIYFGKFEHHRESLYEAEPALTEAMTNKIDQEISIMPEIAAESYIPVEADHELMLIREKTEPEITRLPEKPSKVLNEKDKPIRKDSKKIMIKKQKTIQKRKKEQSCEDLETTEKPKKTNNFFLKIKRAMSLSRADREIRRLEQQIKRL